MIKYWALYSDFKEKPKVNILYNLWFLMRRAAYAACIAFLQGYIVVQLVLVLVSFIPITLYQIIFRPYKSTCQNIMLSYNEIVVTVCVGFFFFWSQPQYGTMNSTLGWVVNGILISNMAINLIYIFTEKIIDLV